MCTIDAALNYNVMIIFIFFFFPMLYTLPSFFPLSLHDAFYFELAQRILVHSPAHLHQLCPSILISALGPLLESSLKLLSGQSIICDAESIEKTKLAILWTYFNQRRNTGRGLCTHVMASGSDPTTDAIPIIRLRTSFSFPLPAIAPIYAL